MGWKGPLKVIQSNPPAVSIFNYIRLLRALSNLTLNVSRDGASTSSLGNLCQRFTTLTVKNFFLTSSLNLLSFTYRYWVVNTLGYCPKDCGRHGPASQIRCRALYAHFWVSWVRGDFVFALNAKQSLQSCCKYWPHFSLLPWMNPLTCVRGSHCDKGRVESNPGARVWASSSVKICLGKHRMEICPCQHGSTTVFPLNFTSSLFLDTQVWTPEAP